MNRYLNILLTRAWLLAIISVLVAGLTACVTKTPAPEVPNAVIWQRAGFIAGQVNGFTRDSFRINENFNYGQFIDPFQSHFWVDTIAINGSKQPLHIFNLSRYDSRTQSFVELNFALDSLQGRVRRPSVYFPQRGFINYVTAGPNGSIIAYQSSQTGIYGANDDVIQFNDLVYNQEVNRVLGSFRFREYLGIRDTTKLYGPEIKGSFDMFIKRKLR